MTSDEEIYHAYPRHVARLAALTAIQKAVKRMSVSMGEEMARMAILKATQLYALSSEGRRPDRQFIPHPATWFNAERYLDDPEEWECSNGTSQPQRFESRAERHTREAIELMDREEAEAARRNDGRTRPVC